MTEGFANLGNKLDDNVNKLIAKLNELKDINAKQSEEINRLNAELDFCKAQVIKSQRDLECCKTALALKANDNAQHAATTDDARQQINQLVRGIDECIALLKQ